MSSPMHGSQHRRDRGGRFSGNGSHRGRGAAGDGGRGRFYGGRGGNGGRGRSGGSITPRFGLHQASQSFSRASSSSCSTQVLEEQLRALSLNRSPTRHPPGTFGTKCMVKTNHFPIRIEPFVEEICHYDVSIVPEVTTAKVNRVLMEELVKLYAESDLDNLLLAYDGQKSFYTIGRLPFISKEFPVTLPKEAGFKKMDYVAAISLVNVIDLNDLRLFLNGSDVELPQVVIQALDVILRQMPTSKYNAVKRSFFCKSFGCVRIGDGLEAWRGFYQSIRLSQIGLSLNIDIMAAVYFEEIGVVDYVKQLLRGRDMSTAPLSDYERAKIKRALKGLKIEVTHRGKPAPIFSISGITSEPMSESNFGENGDTKHVIQHFRETYNIVLNYTSLPCLKVGNKGTTYLPMELCMIIGSQRYTKKLNEKQTASLLNMNSLHPSDRESNIIKIVSENRYENDEYCNKFGIKISESLMPVQARILPSPRLKYGDSGNEKQCQPRGGQWNMQNKKMFEGGTVGSWLCINFERNVSDSLASNFCRKLASVCNEYGLTFNVNPMLPTRRARPDMVESAIENLYKEAVNRLKPQHDTLDLLIAILPDSNGSLYGEVKRICETKLGIVSQCLLCKTVMKNDVRSMTMIAEKINVKVGGKNVVLEDALMQRIPLVSDMPTLIFGADVSHPNPGNDSSPSIAAVVAALNYRLLTNYVPAISAQAARQERIQDMYKMSKQHFLAFYEKNNLKPERILFFRDGVSEGQFDYVLPYELETIQQAWMDTFNASEPPPITFVVVQKRHHTRFFPANYNDPESADKTGNIHPGTVIDTGICHPQKRDFYLNSHAGIKGTNRPAHYYTFWDDNNFSEDQLQTLTNNLCYTYERCTRSVSYVAPAFYAHLLASRARHYLGIDSSSEGSVAAAGNVAGGGEQGAEAAQDIDCLVKQLPELCDNLKKRQYFI